MTLESSQGRCSNHSDRLAIGICVECRRPYCDECITKFQGINRCTKCLPQTAAQTPAPRRQPAAAGRWAETAVITMGYLALSGLFLAFSLIPSAFDEAEKPLSFPENLARLQVVTAGLDGFRNDMGRYPSAEEGLDALQDSEVLPRDERELWDGPYVRGEVADTAGWFDVYDHQLFYQPHRDDRAAVVSPGFDGQLQTDFTLLRPGEGGDGDDVVVWTARRGWMDSDDNEPFEPVPASKEDAE